MRLQGVTTVPVTSGTRAFTRPHAILNTPGTLRPSR